MLMANADHARVELDRSRFLHIVNAAGTTVTCLEGSLWLTQDGCARDFELAPGQSFRVEGASRVIVSAFGPGLAQVAAPAAQPRADAIRRPSPAQTNWGRPLASA